MPERIMIEGGVPLRGEIAASGAKNAALPLMAASLLMPGKLVLHNVPDLRDVRTMRKLLEHLGVQCEGDGTLSLDSARTSNCEAPYELVKTMRASVLVLGPLLARFGKARVSQPGGCAIGARPINRHVEGLQAMGATVHLEHGYVVARVDRLRGAQIVFEAPTVTGTENLMMAAVLAEGESVLVNAAREPEVKDLADALNLMGARISGAGTAEIRIQGVTSLAPATYTVMPDRIETGTYIAAAGITGGDVTVRGCVPGHLRAVIERMKKAGVDIEEGGDWIRARCDGGIKAVDVVTDPFPGFPTDMQAQFMALMTLSEGLSTVTETIFEQRFMHVPELCRMGADITLSERRAVIRGVRSLSGAPLMATDLRASASLVLAGLGATEGVTEISRIYHLDRGYEVLDEKLASLGARIWRTLG
ncbi:MAG: UDP-N-acetylglucosamine 1-carboxyvinyltransferase [bacterium]|nr:UDP-N-acetylglucosamine 1-carboxyvinyltransferase [bacterium]MDT8395131.1 UDP-N-acetylglucosamine 1-carboxyvinyltransferase [bacterium]